MTDTKPVTKKALNDFIHWSSTRYNRYLGFGSKKQNVDTVYNSLKNGYFTDERGREDKAKIVFTIECSGSVGENGLGRVWRIKQGGDVYTVDCATKTISTKYTKRSITFLCNPTT
jgi:hypothetical protein